MRTFSFVTIFSIEKCSVRLGAFGAKLRRVKSFGLICSRKSDLAPKLTDHVMCNVEHTVAKRLAGILEHVKRTGMIPKCPSTIILYLFSGPLQGNCEIWSKKCWDVESLSG